MTSTIKVDNIQNQPGTNIIDKCGTTITLGASGDTINLASGASQSGFGRTGTVDWQTGDIKTGTFTAVSGKGYFCNTTASAFTMNLPASPSAGDIVGVRDYANTFQTYNLTIGRNGSLLESNADDRVCSVNAQEFLMVYVDGVQGWIATSSGTGSIGEIPTFISACVSGACNTLCTAADCSSTKIATFINPGTFTVNSISNCASNNVISYLVVGGGGGGGSDNAGGGGAGGFREVKSPATPYTSSPLDGYPSAPNRITVTATAYPIAIGAGAAQQTGGFRGNSGCNSTFSTITAAGGGGGGSGNPGAPTGPGLDGGSGGGAYYLGTSPGDTGTGNTPPTTPSQGEPGGIGTGTPGANAGGGGGGATAAGTQGSTPSSGSGGDGGAGATTEISGSPVAYAGGGGGGAGSSANAGNGGAGGGGYGSNNPGTPSPHNPGATPVTQASSGTINTGGGGGGSNGANPGSPSPSTNQVAGGGGSGIVIIRYKFQ